MKGKTPFVIWGLFTIVSLAAGSCSKNDTPTPTISSEIIQTQAVETFSAGLTQTALAQPTETATLTPSATASPSPTVTPSLTSTIAILPTSSCNSLTSISDVTIPDNSKLTPGETFTKTWRVKNTGSCDWEDDFQVRLFSGNALEGKTISLEKTIKAGTETDLSIIMTAPQITGVYTGTWRMADGAGYFFGDSFYVMINIVDGPTTTSTKTPPASTPTIETIPSDTPFPSDTPGS